MDCHIERGDGAMVYRIYNRHVAQWQTHYLDNRGMRGLRLGIRNMFGFTPTHRAVREAVEGDAAMTEPKISEMQAANTVNRIRGYFESKRMEIEGNSRAFRREAQLAKVVRLAGELVEAIEGIGDDGNDK